LHTVKIQTMFEKQHYKTAQTDHSCDRTECVFLEKKLDIIMKVVDITAKTVYQKMSSNNDLTFAVGLFA